MLPTRNSSCIRQNRIVRDATEELSQIIDDGTYYHKLLKKYCGTTKTNWRISENQPESDTDQVTATNWSLIDANTGLSLLSGTGLTKNNAFIDLQANGDTFKSNKVTSDDPDHSRQLPSAGSSC
jgi:hypothetical protein